MNIFKRILNKLFGKKLVMPDVSVSASKLPIGRMLPTKSQIIESIIEKKIIDSIPKKTTAAKKKVVSRRTKWKEDKRAASMKLSMGYIEGWKPRGLISGRHRSQLKKKVV